MSAKKKASHGGKRIGSGRKPTGRKVASSSINLLPERWEKLDLLRGEKSRSAWMDEKIKRARLP